MRTTLNLDDGLMKAVKRRARATNQTITAVIEDALRTMLSEPTPRERFELRFVTVPGGPQPGVDVADRDALYDLMDET